MTRLGIGMLLAVLALSFGPGSLASATSFRAGLRVTITGFDPDGPTLDIDVTGYREVGYDYDTLWLGFDVFFFDRVVPAVDWGDGATVPPYAYGPETGIPLAGTTDVDGHPVKVFRGSFSHTYPGPGIYRVGAASFVSVEPPVVITGNLATIEEISFGYVYYFLTDYVTADLREVGAGAVGPSVAPTMTPLGLLGLALVLLGIGVLLLRRA